MIRLTETFLPIGRKINAPDGANGKLRGEDFSSRLSSRWHFKLLHRRIDARLFIG